MTSQIFIDATWKAEIRLTNEVLNYLERKKVKSLALFTNVQFSRTELIKGQLKSVNIEVNQTKAKRTSSIGQILGCDLYHDSFEEPIIEKSDAVMYIGDGLFHPKALLLSQIKKPVIKQIIQFDPTNEKMTILDKDAIEKEYLKKIRNLKMYINAKTIGIFVTIKPGQQYLKSAEKLKESLEKQGKLAYLFIDDTLKLSELENYPFIEAWVNTACPRIGTDDILNTSKPLINLREAADPAKELEELQK